MPFVAAVVVWLGYTGAWWGWEALTDRVPNGDPQTFHWPSIKDLVSPGRIGYALPPKAGYPTGPSSSGGSSPNVGVQVGAGVGAVVGGATENVVKAATQPSSGVVGVVKDIGLAGPQLVGRGYNWLKDRLP